MKIVLARQKNGGNKSCQARAASHAHYLSGTGTTQLTTHHDCGVRVIVCVIIAVAAVFVFILSAQINQEIAFKKKKKKTSKSRCMIII
jgi:hypothetical protein